MGTLEENSIEREIGSERRAPRWICAAASWQMPDESRESATFPICIVTFAKASTTRVEGQRATDKAWRI